MPGEFWTDATRMVKCGGWIAAGAVPVGIAALALARRAGAPLVPPPRKRPVPWGGFELLFVFLFAVVAPMELVNRLLLELGFYRAVYGPDAPPEAWQAMQSLWAAVFFTPLYIVSLALIGRALYGNPQAQKHSSIAARVALGVVAWIVLHPVVAIIHGITTAIFVGFDWVLDEHPLAKSFHDGRPEIDGILLVVQAAIATPILEELLFRGLLLPWILGKRYRAALAMVFVLLVTAAASYDRGVNDFSRAIGPIGFASVMLAGFALLQVLPLRKRRTLTAIYASAACFAAVHMSVWPTPIPLFVLGLGLGWLAFRTRGILAPAIVHGLFNAVSVLFVLGA
ncbi:MAG TPA: CPBP family intramembrane glutamic endopeptidase [Urbifossiella sp.]|nr:CPBP family intramembrane glutamic endopeptidase [Urbifossiella sp.]